MCWSGSWRSTRSQNHDTIDPKEVILLSAMNQTDYLKNPCGVSSVPYWKAKTIRIPEDMIILHHTVCDRLRYGGYTDQPYFRLLHNLRSLSEPALPQGYARSDATLREFAAHINGCYGGAGMREEELRTYGRRPVYDATLWLAVREVATGELVATGIGELDGEIGEGVLEWIQVSKNHRGRGLGQYLVRELLWRMRGRAEFVTVSGQCHNPTNPEGLYRRCGFAGNDVWHILRKGESL